MRDFHRRVSRGSKMPMCTCHKHTDRWLSYIEPSCGKATSFMFYIVDADTGYGLPGAEFALMKNDEIIFKSYANRSGAVWFPPLKQGIYTLKELVYPEKYVPEQTEFPVQIDYNRNIMIGGIPIHRFNIYHTLEKGHMASFTITKYDVRNGMRLQGAVFALCQDDTEMAMSTSDVDGFVTFRDISAGIYHLIEKQPPLGYMKIEESHVVVVANDGTVTIDGHTAEQASIGNKPILYNIFFIKQDEQTGEPLQGAVFELLEDSVVLHTATSNEKGEIHFGCFAPGIYSLREQKPTVGYQANPYHYTVVVAQDGVVTIDGIPIECAVICDKAEQNVMTVCKVDENQEPVKDVAFRLLQEETVVADTSTDEKGQAVFTDLKAGTYMLLQLDKEGEHIEPFHIVTVSDEGVVTVDDQEMNMLECE